MSTEHKRPHTVAAEIAQTAQARHNCMKSGNDAWHQRHGNRLDWIARNLLPSGSGIDSGTAIDADRCNSAQILLFAEWHSMNDAGFYTGWISFRVSVRATFGGFEIDVRGRFGSDRGTPEYLCQAYDAALSQQFAGYPEGL